MPKGVHDFLSQMTIGKLRIPEEFLLPFEVTQVDESLGKERKLIPAHLMEECKTNPTLLSAEIEKRKRQMTLMVSAFIISKVFVQDIFDDKLTLETMFDDTAP